MTFDSLKKIPPKSRAALHRFLSIRQSYAEIGSEDEARFYEFIRICHETRVKLTDAEVNNLLIEAGIAEREASELAVAYFHIRTYLRGGFQLFNRYRTDYKTYLRENDLL